MSIIINGMNMPKGNSVKNLLIYSDGRVFTGHKDDVIYSAEERQTGKWIDISDGVFDAMKCNVCGKIQDDPSNFCPVCGAKMEGRMDV